MKLQTKPALSKLAFCIVSALSTYSSQTGAFETNSEETEIEKIEVVGKKVFKDTNLVSPTSILTSKDFEKINVLTSEDTVSYQPNLVVRRRYVGDPNGVIGIRGSGMFQTARSLVFADGLPLHYLLQTRWSGAPRWSLVGPDEIVASEVIYGPYSAEYAGNSMGGVVNLTTRNPTNERFVFHGTLMSQDYNHLGTKDTFNGNKVFTSYANVVGNLGYYLSYMRLANDSHPLSNHYLSSDDKQSLIDEGVSGFIDGKDDHGNSVIYIGDSGAESSITSLYKGKFTYDLDTVQLRATLAYEDRERQDEDKRNYLIDSNGNSYWQAGNRNFEERFHERQSLLLGVGLRGDIADNWIYDFYATDFSIRKDEEIRTGLNRKDPAYGSRNGRKTEYKDTGWQTFSIKFATESLLNNSDHRLALGIDRDSYELAIYPSDINALTGEFIKSRATSKGSTSSFAVFGQYGWDVNKQWDIALGIRFEDWQTKDGFYDDTYVADRSETDISPKFSVGYQANEQLNFRYSVAKAVRFPIAEELYRNEDATTNIVVADPTLAPERGIFHNLSVMKELDNGNWQVNLFHESIDDTIYYQGGTFIDNGVNVHVSSFLGIDKVVSKGAEFILSRSNLFNSPLDITFNASYTDAKLERNSANTDIEGNELPRVPHWRAKLLMSYQLNKDIDANVGVRYASDTFSELDNKDKESNVYGAIDSYVFVNAKANWQVTNDLKVSLGVDNIFNRLAYVVHPWPSRTVYLEAKFVYE